MEKTGGLLASPEIDEGFTKCGRYAYCWCRDAAFITGALDKCGLGGNGKKAFINGLLLFRMRMGAGNNDIIWMEILHPPGGFRLMKQGQYCGESCDIMKRRVRKNF